jgi:4-carboxymuconolactone decarboxylase
MTSRKRPHEVRLAPATDLAPEIAELVSANRSGKPMNVTGTLANHPAMLPMFTALGGYLARDGVLEARTRELAILRIGFRAGSVYEFGQHRIFGAAAGLSDTEISAICKDIGEWAWTDEDRNVLLAVDELHNKDCLSDGVWNALRSQWAPDKMIEFLVLVGYYRLIAGVLNSCGVERDAGVPGWPDDEQV